ncbi:protealysin inhibitor emfourin [Schumannella soli]|uniref:protealysin inhibitor emfourin n=1 Tax=Schumannella soli TaxID=2590779 RepID=UPI001C641715|nr:protealysin inhibitor emfourin [Schumannella soli]
MSVSRTGGVAGIRREWRIDVDGDGRADWILLLDACPWSTAEYATEAPAGPRGADRMTWTIAADGPEQARRAEVPEPELTGPWRELVDRVRRDGEPVAARGRALPREERPIRRRPVEPRGGA